MEYQDTPANPATYLPEREAEGDWHCHCLRIDSTGHRSYCDQQTGSPDKPFCQSCDDRHVGFPALSITVVTTTYNTRAEAEAWEASRISASGEGR